jgi:hypothetical protein
MKGFPKNDAYGASLKNSRIHSVEVVTFDVVVKYFRTLADLTVQGSTRVDIDQLFAVVLEGHRQAD